MLLVENCDIKLDILNKSTHLDQSETQITVISELLFCEGFSIVHVIITTIIIKSLSRYGIFSGQTVANGAREVSRNKLKYC